MPLNWTALIVFIILSSGRSRSLDSWPHISAAAIWTCCTSGGLADAVSVLPS